MSVSSPSPVCPTFTCLSLPHLHMSVSLSPSPVCLLLAVTCLSLGLFSWCWTHSKHLPSVVKLMLWDFPLSPVLDSALWNSGIMLSVGVRGEITLMKPSDYLMLGSETERGILETRAMNRQGGADEMSLKWTINDQDTGALTHLGL